jgi:hypothetical protein
MINIVYGNIYFKSAAPSTIFNKIFIALIRVVVAKFTSTMASLSSFPDLIPATQNASSSFC